MTIVDLLSQLRQVGIQLTLDGDKLKIKAPQGALTDELKEQLKLNKEAIIAFLQRATQEVTQTAFPKVDRSGQLPLSYMQQGLWFVEQLTPGTAAYTMPIAFKVVGTLDAILLEQAVGQVMARQESLRTRFVATEQGIPHAVIDAHPVIPFVVEECQVEPSALDQTLRAHVAQQAMSTFDLERGPLFRLKCIRFFDKFGEPLVNLLVGAMHHIISDGWSLNVFVKEIFVAYLQKLTSLSIPVPPLDVQYVDFAAWQQEYLRTETYAKKLNYWEQHLKGIPSHLALPTDFPRPFVQTNNGSKYEFSFPSALCERFGEFCRDKDVTLFMGLMAAWQFVMYKYSHQEDFCLGIPTAGRNHKALENIIGFFIDPIIVRSKLSEVRSLLENLYSVKREVLDAFENQEVPLAQILDRLQIPRNPAYSPVAQVGFQLQNFSGVLEQSEADKMLFSQVQQLTKLSIERVKIEDVASKFDMILSLAQNGNDLSGYVEYNADLFSRESIEKIITHFETAIQLLMTQPECLLRDIGFCTEKEIAIYLGLDHFEEIRPLTDTQKLLFIDAQVNPQTRQNGIGIFVDFPEGLDVNCVTASLDYLATQYSVLKTRFVNCDIPWLEPVYQIVAPRKPIELPVENIGYDSEAALDALCREWIYRPYDIFSEALYEYRLLARHDGRLRLIFRGHHILLDGASGVFWLEKLGQTYRAIKNGEPLPEFRDRFGEFISVRRRDVDSAETLNYWSEKFGTCVPLTFNRIPGATRANDYEIHSHVLSSEHAAAIREYCKKSRTHTLDYFRLLTHLLVQHYCRPEGDFVVNEVLNNRITAKDDTLGVFYQMLPWVVSGADLNAPHTVRVLLDGMVQYRKETRPYRYLSSMAQMQRLEPGTVSFQYNYINFFKEFYWMDEVADVQTASALVERSVQVFVKETSDSFLLQFWVDRTVFDDHRFLQRMDHLSSQVVFGKIDQISKFDFVLPEEAVLTASIAKSNREYEAYGTILPWFEQSTRRFADKVAVKCGIHSLTYAALNAKANKLAHALIDRDITTGSRVAILLSRRVEMLIAVWGVLKAGASYVPIEASYPCERIHYIVKDSAAQAIITESCLQSKIGESSSWLIDIEQDDLFQAYSDAAPKVSVDPQDEIYVIYTSGSTGQPKGASVNHCGEVNLQHWYLDSLSLNAQDSALIISAFGFDLTQKNLFALLLVGGTLVLPEMDEYDEEVVKTAIFEHNITLINCAPSAFYPLVANGECFEKVATLRWVVLGGEPIRLQQLYSWLANPSCAARLVNSYGPTECTDVVAFHVLDRIDESTKDVPIGKSVPNCELYVLDSALRPVAPGLIGELCVSGICVGNGYVNRPEQTQEAFLQSPFGPGKLYRTGDLVRLDETGHIHYIGRKDFQVKIRGLRIELGEIEKALSEQNKVTDSLVLVKDERLVAYIVASSEINIATMRDSLRARLPEYMVPAAIVRLDAWPLTPNGKVDRKALPMPGDTSVRAEFIAPRNEIEARVAQIWQEVLKTDSIGIYDNFFDLGGHSLLATQILSRIRKTFDTSLNLRELLSEPTVAALAELVTKTKSTSSAIAISHIDRSSRIPLSFAQQRLWLLDKLEPGNIAYNVPIVLEIIGNLNVSALRHAISDVINRHEGLRTVFLEDEHGPYQKILSLQSWVTPEVELNLELGDQEFLIRRHVAQAVAYPFSLMEGPLFNSKLLKIEADRWILTFVAHHIVTDGWSMGVLVREVMICYLAYAKGLPLNLTSLPIQYADYAAWQRHTINEDNAQIKKKFWKSTLDDVPALTLPTDRPRPKLQTFNGDAFRFTFNHETSQRFAHIAKENATTPFNVILALFSAVLSRYSGQDDFAVGTPVAGRQSVELENIIGFFVNTVALRVNPRGDLSLNDLVKANAQISGMAFEHQDIPFEDIVDAVDPVRDMSRSPLFQVMLVLQNIPIDGSGFEQYAEMLSDVKILPVNYAVETAKYDLTLTVADTQSELDASIQFNRDLFDMSTIEKIAYDLQSLASQWLKQPQVAFSSLELISAEEKQLLLERWNDTARNYDRKATVQSMFLRAANAYPERKAVICGEEFLTYADLEIVSAKVAACLRAQGVAPGDRVGVCFNRSLHLMTALLGVVRAGATYVPIDASYPQGRINHIVQSAGIEFIVTKACLQENLPPSATIFDLDAFVQEADGFNDTYHCDGSAEDIFYVIYTSGSTGVPKGAAVYQQSEVNLLEWYINEFSMTPDDRVMLMSAIGFDLTQKNLWSTLASGACLVIPPFQEYDPYALADIIKVHNVSWINCAPSAFYPLIDDSENSNGLDSLRWIFLGGEPISYSRLQAWYLNVTAQLVNSYGPTECTDIASYFVIPRHQLATDPLPIGRPNYNVQLYILGRNLELLPKGAIGELCIGGDGVGPGYIGDPEQTEKVFVSNPFGKDSKLYRTGDLARYLPNGNVEYLGRIDQQVKLRGYRIEIGEIQAVINSSQGVKQSFVAVQKIGANELLAAWVVAKEGQINDDLRSRIQARLTDQLPLFMRPQAIAFVDEFPLTPNGKIDRKALPNIGMEADGELRMPTSALEQDIHSIWTKVLGLANIGMDQNFFDLGGNSLLATQIIARVNKAHTARLTVRTLFDNSTLEAFCRCVEQSEKGSASPSIETMSLEGDLPLSYGQSRLWYFEQINPGSCANNMPGAVRLRGDLELDALDYAVNEMVRRHAVLRSTYHFVNEVGPVTRIAEKLRIVVAREDFSDLKAEAQDEAFQRCLALDVNTPFDIEKGPLLRVKVAYFGESNQGVKQWGLFFCMHHIASDGLSMNIMLRELLTHYVSYSQRRPLLLPELRVQYPDFARWQKNWLESNELETQLNYWLKQLANAPELNTFPTDFPRPEVQTTNGNVLQIALPEALTREVERFAKAKGITPFIVTFTAWKMVMGRYAQTNDITVGIPTTGRTKPELEPLIGFFISSALVRSRWDSNAKLSEILEDVKTSTLEAFAHGDIPLDLLFQKLDVKRTLAHAPLIQVAFQLFSESESTIQDLAGHFGGLEVEPVYAQRSTAHFDMIFSLRHAKGEITGALEYNSDLYRADTVATILKHFERTLDAMLRYPEQRLRDLDLATESELKQVLHLDADVQLRPLTDTQKLLFLDALMNPHTVQNSIGFYADFPFIPDTQILEAAINHIANIYSVFRTHFMVCDAPWAESAYQVVQPLVRVPLIVDATFARSEQELEAITQEWNYCPYNITSSELFGFRLLPHPNGTARLLMRCQHIVSDGTSLVYLVEKLGLTYDALVKGQQLPVWNDRFAEHIANRRADVDDSETVLFWKEKFIDVQPLSFSKIPDAVRNADYEVISYYIDPDHTREVHAYCKKNRAHAVDYFRLLTHLLIRHYCRPEGTFLVNEVQNGRTVAKDDTLGVFYQMMPWVIDPNSLKPEKSFKACFDGFSHYRKEIRHHRQLSILQQIRMLEPGSVAFQFNYFNFLQAYEWLEQPVEMEMTSAHVERTVQCFFKELSDCYLMQLWCDRTVFDDQFFHERLVHLSRQIVSGSAQSLGDLDFILPREREKISALIQVKANINNYESVIDWFEAAAIQYKNKVAIVCGQESITYDALNRSANQLAHYLQENGLKAGERVAILLGRRVEMITSVLAVLKAGASYVPVDIKYPCERIQYIVNDSGATFAITDAKAKEKLVDANINIFNVDSQMSELNSFAFDGLPEKPKGSQEIYVIYTSGSTGQPKGASVNHVGEVNLQTWYLSSLQLNSSDSTLVISAFGFDLTQKNLFAMLLCGGQIVLPDTDEYDVSIIRSAIASNRITLLNCAPSAFYPLVSEKEFFPDVQSLRWVVLGGEPIRLGHLSDWLSDTHCNTKLVNSYGPTECTDVVSYHVVENDDIALNSIPIGIPVPNCELHILDEYLKPVAPGLVGELCVTGICVGNGYLNRPDQTAQAFVDSPFGPGKLYKTGDLCRLLNSGKIEYVGRKDFQVKLRGLRIELGEIENALNSQAAIEDSLVMLQEERLIAYVVSHSVIDSAAIRTSLREHLPEYMLPSIFVRLDEWPLTPNGKVDRKALPKPSSEGVEDNYVAPRTETELRLASIWQAVFNLERIGIKDNFFELGGHSLLAVRLVGRISQNLSVNLSVSEMLRASTVEALAQVIDVKTSPDKQHELSSASPLVKLRDGVGDAAVLFVHPVGGDVLCYMDLVSQWKGTEPIYGLRSSGLDDSTQPENDLGRMLSNYLEALDLSGIRKWSVIGQSLGGTLALALSGRMRDVGMVVQRLVMIDTFMPKAMNVLPDHILIKALGLQLPDGVIEGLDFSTDLWIDRIYHYAKALNMVPDDLTLPYIKRIYAAANANSQCALAVKVESIPKDISVLHVEARENNLRSQEAWVQQGYDFEYHKHAGNHETIMRGDNAKTLAAMIAGFMGKGA